MAEARTIVIGAVGRNGSGKDTLIDYLARVHKVPALSVGDVVRRIAEERGLPTTRENLHKVSEQLMQQESPDVFIRQLIRQIERHDWPVVAVSGIRTPTDAETFRQRFGEDFLLVHVEVGDAHARYERLTRRDEPRDPQSFEDFEEQERAEEKQFRLSATIGHADLTIPNDGSLDEFHRRIETQLVQPYLKGAAR
jgi:dephospho-CoA kinase